MTNQEDYVIEKATREDHSKIIEFLKEDFFFNEPLNASMEMDLEAAGEFFAEIVTASLNDPVSYVVRAESGRIVGVRLAAIIRRPTVAAEQQARDANYTYLSANEKTWKMRPVQRLLNHMESKIWELVPDHVHTLLNWLVLSVHRDFTRRGIASQLIEYNWDEVRTLGCQGFIAEATAFKSQKLFERHGYERLYAVELAEWKDENGDVVFKCADQTTAATLEFLPLPHP
ncbi:hypothetical protein M3Y99_01640500 [Aphelenchoides fujianensis]|nr:hypothetical protein M3Y99_01640500 [Aphelenchoides fujianensis]